MTKISNLLYQKPALLLGLLIGPPLLYMLGFYILPLGALLLNSVFGFDDFTGQVVRQITPQQYIALGTNAHLAIISRTAIMAVVVTLVSVLLAFPLAYYIARHASPRTRSVLYLCVLLPLWSSYLVKVYAWKLILAQEGIVSWFFAKLGLSWLLNALLATPVIGGPSLSISVIGVMLAFVYTWLPYMILPIQAALERLPKSLLDASGDLGALPIQTFKHVTLPLVLPGIVAGSIFTFSLTLGDFVIPTILGDSSDFIGNAVYTYQGTSGQIPLAAAMTVVPVVIMILYLIGAKRMGAFEAL